MPTKDDLLTLQNLDIETKVMMSKARIREFISRYGTDSVYVSFSGGKDSTVLLDIVRQVDKRIVGVFSDTGLEYPELKAHVKTFENIITVRPKIGFKEVLHKYGYPVITKQISHAIATARNTPNGNVAKNRFFKPIKDSMYNFSAYTPLVTADLDFKISDQCCTKMKKDPMHKLNMFPIIGTMTVESQTRKTEWLKNGCNSYEGKIQCKPLSFWTEKDIYEYTIQNNLKQCSVYGEFTCNGCTGEKRTGCIYCAFGAHLNADQRYVNLKNNHPELYKYCMVDLGFEHVLRTIEKVMKKDMYNL